MEYFAKIEEPKKLRISLMMAAKESIVACSMLENIEDMRQKKLNLLAELREDFKDSNALCKQLSELVSDEKTRKAIMESFNEFQKKEMAQHNVSPAPKVTVPKVKTQAMKNGVDTEEPMPIEVKKKTDVDRLEYTLSQIEQKLAELNK